MADHRMPETEYRGRLIAALGDAWDELDRQHELVDAGAPPAIFLDVSAVAAAEGLPGHRSWAARAVEEYLTRGIVEVETVDGVAVEPARVRLTTVGVEEAQRQRTMWARAVSLRRTR